MIIGKICQLTGVAVPGSALRESQNKLKYTEFSPQKIGKYENSYCGIAN